MTVSAGDPEVRSMGGLRVLPDTTIDALDPRQVGSSSAATSGTRPSARR